jgi:site-specific DNA-adenine methylase
MSNSIYVRMIGVKRVKPNAKPFVKWAGGKSQVLLPYRPLSQTSNFTAYAQDGFGDNEQAELARFIDELSDKGAFVVASNSDPKKRIPTMTSLTDFTASTQ